MEKVTTEQRFEVGKRQSHGYPESIFQSVQRF